MKGDDRHDIQPVIDELLELIEQHSPGSTPQLGLQQGVSRLVFEAYRRGLRRGRRPRSSSTTNAPLVEHARPEEK